MWTDEAPPPDYILHYCDAPNEFAIKELAEKIIDMTQSASQLIYKTLPENDPVRRQPDITLAKKILGWKPSIEL